MDHFSHIELLNMRIDGKYVHLYSLISWKVSIYYSVRTMKKMFNFLKKLELSNEKKAATLISIILVLSGVVMIFMGIKDTGTIGIKSSIVSGNVESGFVGVSLTFLGVIVSIINRLKGGASQHKVNVKGKGFEISWEGKVMSHNSAMESIKRIINDLETKNNNNS